MNPSDALLKYFGFKDFRKNQLEIIEAILQGNNVVAVLPTGAGKSLCYQVPALMSENFSIVVSPLIALMKDQVDSLNSSQELSAFINSTMEFYEAEKVMQNIAFGKTKILYVAPERLENTAFAERIKSLKPSYLFIDEAHCISEWGHNFRPSYRKIKEFAEYTEIKKISAFTATATPEVVEDISQQLALKNPKIFVKGFERENLYINVIVTKNKNEKCSALIRQFKTPTVIYTSSRRKAEEISEYLNMNMINCAYYHAGMAPEERKRIQEDFLNDKIPVIAATNAFGMGIDKKDIRLVVHYNTPGSIENYYQEIGRAGRDNKPSYAFLLHDDSDINIHKFFISNSNPDKELIQNVYNAICDYGKIAVGNKSEDEIPINPEFISSYCKRDVSRGLLHTVLRSLDNAGYLKIISEFNRKSTLQVNLEKSRLKSFIKNSSSNNIREVLLSLLREYSNEILISKINLNLPSLAHKLDMREDDLEETLITLDNLGIVTYKKSLAKENVMLTTPRVKTERLIIDYKKINENYLHLQKKIEQMVDFVYSNECRFKYILRYFGEDVQNYRCGKCDHCTADENLTASTSEYLKELILNTIGESPEALDETSLIKILLGTEVSERLQKLSSFGSCSNYTKKDLKVVLHNLISTGVITKKGNNKNLQGISGSFTQKILTTGGSSTANDSYEDYEKNLELFNSLREIRAKTAKKFLQSVNIICPDEIMREVVRKRPETAQELMQIKGFSHRMFNKIGKEFLEAVKLEASEEINNIFSPGGVDQKKNKEPEEKIPSNIKETFNLLKKGYSLKDIASLRKLSEAVISMQIESIIEYEPSVDISHLYDIGQLEIINDEIKNGFIDLKELKKRLPAEITYPMIRIAAAKDKFMRFSLSSTVQDKK